MEITTTLYVHDRAAWRAWLAEHYRTEPDIWLILPNKASGKPALPYNDAVEEALCFGWIDSTVKSVDGTSRAQRYSPRRAGSAFSQINKERLARMLEHGAVASDVVAALGDVDPAAFEFPSDIMDALKANRAAWRNFRSYSAAYRRIRVAYVDGARSRPEEFDKRLANLISKTERGIQFGVNIESYY